MGEMYYLDRSNLIDIISKAMYEEIYNSALLYEKVNKEFCFRSGSIEVTIHRNGKVEVNVFHDNEHKSPMLEKKIMECMPEWGRNRIRS